MRTLQIIPVITSREMVQLTAEQRVFVVLNYTRTQSTTQVRNAFRARAACLRYTGSSRYAQANNALCCKRRGTRRRSRRLMIL